MNWIEFYERNIRHLPLMASVLSTLHISVPPSKMIRNPEYADRNPSVSVSASKCRDFGTGQSYDLLDVLERWGKLSKRESVALLAQMAGLESPVNERPTVRPVLAPPIPERPSIDPSAFAAFARSAHDRLLASEDDASKSVLSYLETRGLSVAPRLCGVGAFDGTDAPLPPSFHAACPGLVIPNWDGERLAGLKARNLESDKSKRQFRNLGGAKIPLYNLTPALEVESETLVVVEGELDTLSVLEAFEMDVSVVGVPGNNIECFSKAPSLDAMRERTLVVALDPDEAGIEMETTILKWAAFEGIRAISLRFGDDDKNALLRRMGPSAFRAGFSVAIESALTRKRTGIARSLK